MEDQQRIQQQIIQMESVVKPLLSREAVQRYANISIAHPEVAIRALAVLYQAAREGKIKNQLSDAEFKQILASFTEKRQPSIRR